MVIFSKRKVAVCVMAALAAQVMAAQAANKEDVIVVTTASGFQQKIEDAAATISVVSREQLEDKAYRDVTDALKDVPGCCGHRRRQLVRYQYPRDGSEVHHDPRGRETGCQPRNAP